MVQILKPLKVVIGLRQDGTAAYPDFNSLAAVQASGMDWAKYVDVRGGGWVYDCCGHTDDAPDSPRGQQLGMLLVPAEFVTQAVVAFPTACSEMTNAEAESFYEVKFAKERLQKMDIDQVRVDNVIRRQNLGQTLTPEEEDSINPGTTTRGVRVNQDFTFAGFLQKRGFQIVGRP